MKKKLVASYIAGLRTVEHGEQYGKIFVLFFPEFITMLLLHSMPYLIDAYFISSFKSTPMYGTLGATTNLLNMITKIAEGISVSTVIMCGYYNGRNEYENTGKSLRDAFWVTFFAGLVIAAMLFFGAHYIFMLYVPESMIEIGVPFLRIKAIAVFFMVIFFSFVGFLRGIKNTKTPMKIFVAGAVAFIISDYIFMFGKFGFPALGIQGSAYASIVQYVFMLSISICYILFNAKYKKYRVNFFSIFYQPSECKRIVIMSLPIMLDKATLAASYIWLCAMFKPMGAYAVATFSVIKDMERLALLPALACAQVVTVLVSNDYGQKKWDDIKANIKKVSFLAFCAVFTILSLFLISPTYIISFFDHKGEFTPLAAAVFPIMSMLVLFDLSQVVLSGALRGASNVRVVMFVRLAVCLLYFVPVSYIISHMAIESDAFKFCLTYGSFYVGNALMSIMYIIRFRGEQWKKIATS